MPYSYPSKVGKKISALTDSLICSLTDAVLYLTFNTLAAMGTRTTADFNYSMYQTDILLSKYNSKSIKMALNNLISRRYLKKKKSPTGIELTITKAGLERINEFIPMYKTNRPWDGYLYLVSYDIPRKADVSRNLLRKYLQKMGCVLLQESLWLTPYNPHGIMEKFIEDHSIPGTILISKLGKDGAVGDEDTKTMIERVYRLKEIADRYEAFIRMYKSKPVVSFTKMSVDYFQILRDDPQLPFSLEPSGFSGKEAHRLFLSCPQH
jgi:DNA-binding transcriptional regulator PaaX